MYDMFDMTDDFESFRRCLHLSYKINCVWLGGAGSKVYGLDFADQVLRNIEELVEYAELSTA